MSYHCETCRRFVPSGITHICVSASTPRTIPVATVTIERRDEVLVEALEKIRDRVNVMLERDEQNYDLRDIGKWALRALESIR